MHSDEIERILTDVSQGALSVEDALLALKKEPFTDLGYAKVDHHRALRQNAAEVVYGAGKTPEQIAGIVTTLQQEGEKTVLITRLKPEAAAFLRTSLPLNYHELSGVGIVGPARANWKRKHRYCLCWYERLACCRRSSAYCRGTREQGGSTF